jgi:hypothetical protein
MENLSQTLTMQYQVYVMRLWRDKTPSEETSSGWRFSIENPSTGQRRGFSSLEELVAFLENLTLLYIEV